MIVAPSISGSIVGKRNPSVVFPTDAKEAGGTITYKPQVADEVEVAFELLKSEKNNIHNIGKEQLLKFRERAVPYLIQGLGSKENWWIRKSSAMMLDTLIQQEVNTEEAIPALIQALRDDEDVKIYSSSTLVKMGAKSVPALLKALDKNQYQRELNHYWHWHVINILGQIKEEARDAVDRLGVVLCRERNNSDLSFYDHILHALRRIGGRRAVEVIREQALKDSVGTRRSSMAIRHLAEIALSKYDEPCDDFTA